MTRKILFLIASIFLTSCTGIFVWTPKDVAAIGLIVAIIIVFIYSWILDKIDERKRNKKH